MSPAYVLEPTYKRLKRRLLEGIWPRGARLDALRLADEFGVSMTPVRDCLNRLVGERLVDFETGHGYHVPALTEKLLRDMIAAHQSVLEVALTLGKSETILSETRVERANCAEFAADVFAKIVAASGNLVFLEYIHSLGDRLFPVRMRESELLPDPRKELDRIHGLAAKKDARLRLALRDYHLRRRSIVPELVQMLY